MLKGIDPVLSPELLKIMAEMGHDDTLVLADANFTAMSLGAGKPIVRLPGVGMLRAVQAVTSLLAAGHQPAVFRHQKQMAADENWAQSGENLRWIAPLSPQHPVEQRAWGRLFWPQARRSGQTLRK